MYNILLLTAIILLSSCGSSSLPEPPKTAQEKNEAMLDEARTLIRTGDIILRCGKDMTSYKIREMSETDKTYSHAGIAIVKQEDIFIYHLTPPELDEPKADTMIRLEPLKKFANPENNFEFGIARYPLTEGQNKKMIAYIDSLRTQEVSFDWLFDLKSKNKMYCSEMVDDCLRYVTGDSISLKKNEFKDPRLVRKVGGYLRADTNIVRSRLYIPIENIYLHRACNMIGQYKFVPVVE